MSERGLSSRQLVVQIFTSDLYFFILWMASTTATAGILLLAAAVTDSTLELLTVVYVSAGFCLAVSFGLGYTLFVLTGVYGRLSQIVAEEGSVGAALGRVGGVLAALLGVLTCASLVLFGQSMLAGVTAAGLFVGLLLASGHIVDCRTASRAMTATERERCGVAVQADAQYRTVIGAAGEMIHARSAGFLPSQGTIYLSKQACDQLAPAQLEALAAHELGHVRGRHPAVVLSANSVTMLLALVAIRELLQSHWALVLIVGGLAVCSGIATAAGQRRVELRADRFAAEHLGDAEQVINMLEAVEASRSEPSQTGRSSVRAAIPEGVQAVGRRLFATHPRTERRIERLRAVESERSVEEGEHPTGEQGAVE